MVSLNTQRLCQLFFQCKPLDTLQEAQVATIVSLHHLYRKNQRSADIRSVSNLHFVIVKKFFFGIGSTEEKFFAMSAEINS
jgi:hypothetical protein